MMESCSIVVPCYNEEEMIPLFYSQLVKVMDSMKDRLDYENQERAAGETKWSLWKLFRYSVEGIVAFSTAPLSLAFFAGMFVLLTAVLTLLWQQSASRNLLPFIFLTVSSIQLFCMGVAGLYLSRIYLESKKRPIYLVREAK